MMRSMFSGVSGLRIHQTMMDIIGNNIANINTIGYKTNNLTFQSMLNQTLKGGSTPTTTSGGANPIQVGLGAQMGSVDTNFVQGNLQSTGKVTDMAIQGDGFFVLKSAAGLFYTRSGNFTFDALGNLVNPADGMIVQGWVADNTGSINTSGSVVDLQIPVDQIVEPTATTSVTYTGNLPATTAIAGSITTSIDVIDSQGNKHTLTVRFTKTAANAWAWAVTSPTLPAAATGNGTITFAPSGMPSAFVVTAPIAYAPIGANAMAITANFGTIALSDGITQFSSDATVAATGQNGNVSGGLQSMSIGGKGEITGIFSNGQNRLLGQIALASFKNASGLLKTGSSLYSESNNSGVAIIGEANSGGRGQIVPGTLEMSNVDLAKEFANMIIAQRGFQANSKIITASDEMLMDLVRLKG
jgi:flagellar hook protein FlgE